MTTTNGTPAHTTTELREQLEQAELRTKLARAKLAESAYRLFRYPTEFGTPIPSRQEAEPEDYQLSTPQPSDRKRGQPYWAYRTLQELWQIQSDARWLDDTNVFAMSPLTAVQGKVIRTGFRYDVRPKKGREASEAELQLCRDELERFDEANEWPEWEQELFRRCERDGEAAPRFFRGDVLKVRTVEPEQIVQPDGEEPGPEWSYGVHCDPEDQFTRLGYFVSYDGDAKDGDEVSAADMDLWTINVDKMVRRGLSSFFCLQSTAPELAKLVRAMRLGGTLAANIAWVEKFASASKDDVTAFADGVADVQKYTDPRTGQPARNEYIGAGTIIRTGMGKDFVGPPLVTGNTMGLIEIARLSRMALCARWNAHESILGASDNGTYASLAVAESPFVTRAEVLQAFYGRRFRRVKMRALQNAVEQGRIPADLLGRIEVYEEPPPVVVRDRLAQAQENEILLRNGVMSPQTWAQIEDLEWDEEQKQTAKAQAQGWILPAAPAAGPVDAGALRTPLGTEPALPADAPAGSSVADQATQGGASASAGLRATVGGSQAVAQLQRSYYSGELPRAAAVANAMIVFGFPSADAERLFPETAPVKLTPDNAPDPVAKKLPTAEGSADPFGLWKLIRESE